MSDTQLSITIVELSTMHCGYYAHTFILVVCMHIHLSLGGGILVYMPYQYLLIHFA